MVTFSKGRQNSKNLNPLIHQSDSFWLFLMPERFLQLGILLLFFPFTNLFLEYSSSAR